VYGVFDSLIDEENYENPVKKVYKNLGSVAVVDKLGIETTLNVNIFQISTETLWFFGRNFKNEEAIKFDSLQNIIFKNFETYAPPADQVEYWH
jgi:hypothetical protein